MGTRARIHGEKLGADILGDAMAGLHRLRRRMQKNSTTNLSNYPSLRGLFDKEGVGEKQASTSTDDSGSDKNSLSSSSVSTEEDSDSDNSSTLSSENSIETHVPPPRKTTDDSHRSNGARLEVFQEQAARPSSSEVERHKSAAPSIPTTGPRNQLPEEDRNNMISKTWQWDVESDNLTAEEIPTHFKKTSDLFAYHALPIARSRLKPDATRKELRHAMQSMMEEMPTDEYDKWVESFQELLNGDRDMLVRQHLAQETTINSQRRLATTPAPIDAQRHAIEIRTHVSRTRYGRRSDVLSQSSIPAKYEPNTDANTVVEPTEAETQSHRVAAAAAAFRELSTEEQQYTQQKSNLDISATLHNKVLQPS
ncbi:hypothetical protein BKA66DRAFT_447354 [Pyrenochaeta sp. MPI-SDFR-AT-0127]|nr:hypothetical protein BKA66DRAFT_447354 [Pyrenochaeta sp. MPI-SDFR-AT-0127]